MDITEMIESEDALLQQALESLCRYHEARHSSVSRAEVERLRQESEVLLKALEEFQVNALRKLDGTNG